MSLLKLNAMRLPAVSATALRHPSLRYNSTQPATKKPSEEVSPASLIGAPIIAENLDTSNAKNLEPRVVPPLDASKLPRGNLISHILEQYKGDIGELNVPLSPWKRLLGEGMIKTFKLDMDRIRSGPVSGVLYRDMCKSQAYFEKGKPMNATAAFYYDRLGLPQTFFEWFQITSLHIWMLYVRMRVLPREYAREYQRKLINGIFEDIDFQLREKIKINSDRTTNNIKKQFSQQLKGSIFGYDEGLIAGDAVLAAALWRNVFGQSINADPTALEQLVHYVRAQLYVLDRMSDADFTAGRFKFLDPARRYAPLTPEQDEQLTALIETARNDPVQPGTRSKLSRDGW